MSDTHERVAALVDELHEVLESADDLDPGDKEALRNAAAEIRESVEGESDESPIDFLRDKLAEFEASHPTITEAVRRLVDQLSEMGI